MAYLTDKIQSSQAYGSTTQTVVQNTGSTVAQTAIGARTNSTTESGGIAPTVVRTTQPVITTAVETPSQGAEANSSTVNRTTTEGGGSSTNRSTNPTTRTTTENAVSTSQGQQEDTGAVVTFSLYIKSRVPSQPA